MPLSLTFLKHLFFFPISSSGSSDFLTFVNFYIIIDCDKLAEFESLGIFKKKKFNSIKIWSPGCFNPNFKMIYIPLNF